MGLATCIDRYLDGEQVQELGEITIKTGRAAGTQKSKRNISIADKSGKSIVLTLWDENANLVEQSAASDHSIIAGSDPDICTYILMYIYIYMHIFIHVTHIHVYYMYIYVTITPEPCTLKP